MSPLVALLFLFRPTPMMTRLKEIKKIFFSLSTSVLASLFFFQNPFFRRKGNEAGGSGRCKALSYSQSKPKI